MQNKFYQDFAAWLDHWLQHNVDDNLSKLDVLDFPNQGDELKPIAMAVVFYPDGKTHYPTHGESSTSDVLCITALWRSSISQSKWSDKPCTNQKKQKKRTKKKRKRKIVALLCFTLSRARE